MFNNLFDYNNPFFRFMSKVADIIMLNLLFVICSLPVFTIGASASALYTITLKLVKDEEPYIVKGFFSAFKNNFRQATLIWMLLFAMGTVLLGDLYLNKRNGVVSMQMLNYVFWILFFLYLVVFDYAFVLTAKFENSIINTLRNALLMGIRHLPLTILTLLINAVPIILLWLKISWVFITLGYMVFFGFGLIACLNSLIFNRIFQCYIPNEPKDLCQ